MAQHGDATSQISNHQPELSINPVIYGMQAIVAGWIFILGACFGSFLNVVIYRLPAGMSLGSPKSRCPKCETPLAARDNIPVFGWLLLRGKCRYCSVPISARYPIIEATCGGIFLLLLFTELLTGGANLPIRHPDHFHVPSTYWLVWLMKWDLSGIYLYHCTMLILALAVAMIGYDGHRPHRGLVRFSIAVGLLFGAAWLELRPVRALQWPDSFYRICWGFEGTESFKRIGSGLWTGVSLIGLLDGVIGLLAGWILGQLAKWQMSFAQLNGATNDQKPAGVFSLLAVGSICQVCGVFLGWQACFMLSFIVLPILGCYGFIRRAASQWRSLGVLMFVILTVFLVAWQKLNAVAWFPDIDGRLRIFGLASWPARLIALGSISVVALLVKMFLKPSDDSENIPTSLENQ